jgi:hypothetical protein
MDLKFQHIKISCLLFWTDMNSLESTQYRGSLLRDLGVTSLIIIGVEIGGIRGEIFDLLLAPTCFLRYSCQEIYNIPLIDGAGVLVYDRERVCVCVCVCVCVLACVREREVLYLSTLSFAQIL